MLEYWFESGRPHNFKLSNLFKMKNETKEPVIEVGMVFVDHTESKYKVVDINIDSNEVYTIDVHDGGDIEPYLWILSRFLEKIIDGRLIKIEPDKLTIALEEIESLKAELATYKEALLLDPKSMASMMQGLILRAEPSIPYYPSRLDFFTAAALTGLVGGVNSYEQDAEHAVEGAMAVISELDKEVK